MRPSTVAAEPPPCIARRVEPVGLGLVGRCDGPAHAVDECRGERRPRRAVEGSPGRAGVAAAEVEDADGGAVTLQPAVHEKDLVDALAGERRRRRRGGRQLGEKAQRRRLVEPGDAHLALDDDRAAAYPPEPRPTPRARRVDEDGLLADGGGEAPDGAQGALGQLALLLHALCLLEGEQPDEVRLTRDEARLEVGAVAAQHAAHL